MSLPVQTRPPAVRAVRGRMLGGVAAGLAAHLGWRVSRVRQLFALLCLFGGFGVLLYAAYWAVLPQQRLTPTEATESGEARGSDLQLTRFLALAAIVIGVLLLLTAFDVPVLGGFAAPVVVFGVGAALLWRQSDDGQRARWRAGAAGAARTTATETARGGRWRWWTGVTLVGFGLASIVARTSGPGEALAAISAGLLLVAGIGVVVFPWAYRQWTELGEERRARIRSQERAEIAAQVHDSVLQTLTLIRRRAGDEREVVRLARAEERALRSWLYAPVGDPARTFSAALQREAADIEAEYGTEVEVVTVGEAPMDARLGALLAATREAVVNAAKHAGDAGPVRVFAEVENAGVEVFVKDRGPGFVLDDVPADRLGLRESVRGRMQRNGGTADIRTTPGEGTEIRLSMPRREATK